MMISVLPRTSLGLGMTREDAISLLSTGNGTPEQLAAANDAYYGEGGYYSKEASVIRADRESGTMTGDYGDFPVPSLYVMENCDPRDVDCVGRNEARQQANMVLISNANNAYNKRICEADYETNQFYVGDAAPYNCGQFTQAPVPPAPGETARAIEVGEGGFLSPRETTSGDAKATEAASKAAADRDAIFTAQQGAANRIPVNLPSSTGAAANQNAVPNTGQAGNIPANTVHDGPTGTGTGDAADSEAGLFGMSKTTLLLIGGAVAAFMLFKGK